MSLTAERRRSRPATAAWTFNRDGKTDLLIRARDRNVFIGECKIWTGPKALGKAVDQLLALLKFDLPISWNA